LDLAPGLVVADRFRLERILGKGGMGAVWLARQIALDVPCAVKFIHPEAARSAELRARFEREAKAAAQLRSPYVVQILDHGVWHDAPYIAMELLDGEDLDHRLARRGKLTPREAMGVAQHVGRALAKAHAAGLVHRDLKPANIFLVRDEDREIAKVLDFGIAKTTAMGTDGSTKTGAVLGTPFYMSPEQARGNKGVDHRSDLWALGVVVYRCVTGQLPFASDALGDLFAKIISDPLPVPSAAAPVPPGFDAWWAHAASRDPAQRFQSARELTDALGFALGVTMSDALEVGMSTPMPATGEPPVDEARTLELPSTGGGTVLLSHAAPTPMQQTTPMPQVTPPPHVAPVPHAAPLQSAPPLPVRSNRLPLALAAFALVSLVATAGFYALHRAPAPDPQPSALPASPAPPSAPPVVDSPAPPPPSAPAPVASASASAPAARPAPSASASRAKAAAHPGPQQPTDYGF
jgi:serine/threonine protein kinase